MAERLKEKLLETDKMIDLVAGPGKLLLLLLLLLLIFYYYYQIHIVTCLECCH